MWYVTRYWLKTGKKSWMFESEIDQPVYCHVCLDENANPSVDVPAPLIFRSVAIPFDEWLTGYIAGSCEEHLDENLLEAYRDEELVFDIETQVL